MIYCKRNLTKARQETSLPFGRWQTAGLTEGSLAVLRTPSHLPVTAPLLKGLFCKFFEEFTLQFSIYLFPQKTLSLNGDKVFIFIQLLLLDFLHCFLCLFLHFYILQVLFLLVLIFL